VSVRHALRRIPGTVLGYVDLHAHALPGIDDGPSDAAGAIALLRAAATSGTGTIAVTPHVRSDFPDVHVDELDRRCRALREAVAREGIDIEVVCGAEVSLVWALEASDEELALATYGQRGTDLLIETPTFEVVGFESRLNQLRAKGLRVTLAHPERNVEFQRAPDRLADLVATASSSRSTPRRCLAQTAARRRTAWDGTCASRVWRTRSPPTATGPLAGAR
jgi:protein-tyrosine phosphatase